MSVRILIVICAMAFTFSNCSRDEAASEALSTTLNSAATYLDTSLPNLGHTVGTRSSCCSDGERDTNFITRNNWDSSTSSEQVSPPGGVVSDASSEPTFDGATMPTSVNYRDYMKMALDTNFKRASNSGTYRPTVFGRFDSLVTILEYFTQAGVVTDSSGPAVGTYTGAVTVEGTTVTVNVTVTAAAVTTFYDRRVEVIGFVDADSDQTFDTGETQLVDNLMWVRNTSSQLNFMMVEQRDGDSDSNIDTYNLSVVSWNRSTGNFMFEYVQDQSDSQSSANMEIFRALIEQSNGKSWVYQFAGKADSSANPGDFLQYALFTPSTSETSGTVSLRQVRSNGDVWLGNICSIFTTGVATEDEAIPEDGSPASGGTCAGQVSDSINTKIGIMGFANGVRAHTTAQETMDDKGFPATANPDFSVAAARTAWLEAGDSISVSFDTRGEFISDWDGTP